MNLIRRNINGYTPTTVEQFFDRFFNESLNNDYGSFTPGVDIAETEKGFEIELAVPGFNKKDFNIELNDGLLTVSGERKMKDEQNGKNFYALQTAYGTFKKSFQLPDHVKGDAIEASYVDGMLNLVIPKDETKKLVNKISVK